MVRLKNNQKQAIDLLLKRIDSCEPHKAKAIMYMTAGRNNWRKQHGFPLMRGNVDSLSRKIHRNYHP